MNFYEDMVDDNARTDAYEEALREVVTHGDVVVDIGTGPFALLACQAARAGAAKVFAIEVAPKAAKAARQFVKMSQDSWASNIELKEGASANVVLPTQADLVVHELIGLIAGCEGAALILRDAFTRHVKQSPRVLAGTWSVPSRARSWLVPVEIPTKKQLLAGGSSYGLKTDPLPQHRLVDSVDNFPFARCALAHPQCFEELDFARLTSDPTALTGKRVRQLKFVCDRPGVFGGFSIFITGEMTPRDVASADAAEAQDPASGYYFSADVPAPGVGFCSAWRDSHWGNLVIRLNLTSGNSLQVECGDIIEVDAIVDITPFQPIYSFRAAVRQQRGEWLESLPVLSGTLSQKLVHKSEWELSDRMLPHSPPS